MAFSNHVEITSLTIPNSVTNIAEAAFYGCDNLWSLTVPYVPRGDDVWDGWWYNTRSGLAFFFTKTALEFVITHYDNIPQYDEYGECVGYVNTPQGGDYLVIKGGAVPETLKTVVVSSNRGIGDNAFYDCSKLNEIWLPKNMKNVGIGQTSASVFYYGKFTRIKSERLSTEDSGAFSVETIATNDCRVTFEWKCSCEPMRKGKMYDYLSFSIDGEQKAAICGETGWTQQVYMVEGSGEHVLKWTYQKDASGSEGEDCGWLRLVSVAPPVTLSFLPGGATEGTVPPAMMLYADDEPITLPSKGSLAWPKHNFRGWSDGEAMFVPGSQYPCDAESRTLTAVWARKEIAAPTVRASSVSFYQGEAATITISAAPDATICYTLDGSTPTAESLRYVGPFAVSETTTIRAIAVKDDYFDSEEATLTVTKDPTTYGDAVNAPMLAFSSDDGTGWRIACGESPDGLALRSGPISHNATSRLEAVVMGEGVVTFSFKVAGEIVKGDVYDGLAFLIDGVQQGELMGNAEWTTNTYPVVGEGEHTVSWLYVKDEGDDEPVVGDCAWLDEFKWVSMRSVVVTLDANDGMLAEGERVVRSVASDPVGDLPVPVRDGWTFLGWFTAVDGGERVTAETVITADLTLYAHWARVVRTVSFDANGGGETPDAIRIESGEKAGSLPVSARSDYVFLGWFTAADGGERVTAETIITADMTLYAHWQCRFVFNDGSMWTQQANGSWKSGETADDSTNSILMAVSGSGTVSFRWKVSCEDYFVFRTQKILCDHLLFLVDGEARALINGETDWTNVTFMVEEAGEHVLSWEYVKDSEGSEGADSAWLDAVTWTPNGASGLAAWLAERNLAAETKAANGRTAAECYALGLDPSLATNDFRIVSIEVTDDGAKVEWEPKTNRWTGAEIKATLKCAATLEGPWEDVPAGGSPGTARPTLRFFKVVVQ